MFRAIAYRVRRIKVETLPYMQPGGCNCASRGRHGDGTTGALVDWRASLPTTTRRYVMSNENHDPFVTLDAAQLADVSGGVTTSGSSSSSDEMTQLMSLLTSSIQSLTTNNSSSSSSSSSMEMMMMEMMMGGGSYGSSNANSAYNGYSAYNNAYGSSASPIYVEGNNNGRRGG
jgi:hypothetical protein